MDIYDKIEEIKGKIMILGFKDLKLSQDRKEISDIIKDIDDLYEEIKEDNE